MKRFEARRSVFASVACGASVLCFVACSAGGSKGDARPPAGAGGAGGGGNPIVNGGSGAAAGSSSSSIGVATLLQSCGTSSLAKPQLRRLTAAELQHSLDDIFPQAKGQWSVGLSEVESPLGFNNDPSLLAVSTQVASKLLTGAQALAAVVTTDAVLANLLPCAASTPNHACAQTFLTQYGKRLFRRPLTQADTDRYLGFFDTQLAASNFKSALGWMLAGLVQSPHAIYRREVGANDGGTYHLTQYEVATELAYTFSGTTPSDALLQQADAGTLQTPDQIAAAAGALLATPNGTEVVHQFFKGWLGYDQVPPTLPNVPSFSAVAPDMVQETTRFIDEVVVTGRGGPKELLSATFTTPSLSLANFYGFPAPASDYARLERPAGRGVGVLAQGSLIAAHSHETASSPTLRGLLVFERLLCGVRPTVPPNVPTLVAPSPGVKTTRQRYEEQHMAAGAACPVCHKNFDPIGFGFEHYDEAGRYRQMEGALPIDSRGTLLSQGQPLFSFTGLDDLATQLATQETVGRCVSGYVTAYAFANGVPCLGEARRADFVAGKLGILDYFASLAAEPSFTTRR